MTDIGQVDTVVIACDGPLVIISETQSLITALSIT